MIPIFIICKDRVTVLQKCIASYEKLGDVEIIIIDNGSTYPPMLEWQLQCPYKIYRNQPAGTTADISESVGNIIEHWYKTNDSPYYIVTDPDIELESPSPKLLEYYADILDKEWTAMVVGPMLRIDDIPDHFCLKEEMKASHILQFWHKTPIEYKESKLQKASIDTTFGMYRKGYKFRRLSPGIRVYEPYMARHLDWYIDTSNLTDEQEYYMAHASEVSSLTNHIKRGKPV